MGSKKKTTIARDDFEHDITYTALGSNEGRTDITENEIPVASVSLEKGWYEYEPRSNAYRDTKQQKLFEAHPSVIATAYSDHSLRARVPTLLGMAINDAKKIGTGLTYDESLTEHSARLARRGVESKVLTTHDLNPNIEPFGDRDPLDTMTNTIRKSDTQYYKKAPDKVVKAGTDTIRGLLRRPNHMGPQFNHPDLDVTWHQPELGQ